MLPKNKRVSKEVFYCVLKNSKTFHSNNITLRVLKSSHNITKFSFIVSRKVSSKAPKRNLLRRRGSSVVAKLDKKIKNGFICIFYIKKGAVIISYSKIEEEIVFLIKKANIMK